jgi:hypothetical protein
MQLNKENYFEFGNEQGSPVMSSSTVKLIRSGDGGSIEKLAYYLENYNALQAARKYNFSLEYGSLLHKYMEAPENFVIADFARPSEMMTDMATAVFERVLHGKQGVYEHVGALSEWGDVVLDVANSFNYQGRWKDETRVKKILEEGEQYFNFLTEKKDAHVLTDKENEVLTSVIDKWLVSPHYAQDNQVNWLREIPIRWDQRTIWGTVQAKSLVDKLYIHHDTRNVIIEDIKTTKSIAGFIHRMDNRMNKGNGKPEEVYISGAFIGYKYYRQLAFYRRAVRFMLQQEGHDPKEYTIKCRILAFENKPPYQIRMYEAPEEWLAVGDQEIDEAFLELKNYYEHYAERF